jgi:hypothetical protein
MIAVGGCPVVEGVVIGHQGEIGERGRGRHELVTLEERRERGLIC